MSIKLQRQYEMTIYPAQYLQTNPVVSYTAPASSPNLNQNLALSYTPPGSFSFSPPIGDAIVIKNPFTLVLNIERKALATVNNANFQIYNLNPATRTALYKDYTDLLCMRRITLKAGYASQGSLSVIFDGNIKWCTSYRKQGSNNFITEIEAFDWAFPVVNAYTNTTFTGNNGVVPINKIVSQCVDDICAMGPSGQQVKRGYIHNFIDSNKNPITAYNQTISDSSWKALQHWSRGAAFIDNGQLNILTDDECYTGSFTTINASTGLLGSPKRSQTYVIVELMFEPSLAVGQQIDLETVSEPQFNGPYKIFGINHAGIISDGINGRLQTNISLFSFIKNAQLIALSQGGHT
jgi:hypothetical protein